MNQYDQINIEAIRTTASRKQLIIWKNILESNIHRNKHKVKQAKERGDKDGNYDKRRIGFLQSEIGKNKNLILLIDIRLRALKKLRLPDRKDLFIEELKSMLTEDQIMECKTRAKEKFNIALRELDEIQQEISLNLSYPDNDEEE